MSILLIVAAVAVIVWFAMRHRLHNRNTNVTAPPPLTPSPITDDEPTFDGSALDEAFERAWNKLVKIDSDAEAPDLDFGVIPGQDSGYVGAPWRAFVLQESAIVDPTFTGPVVYYYNNGDLWMLTLTGNAPVTSEFYRPVLDRLLEISNTK